MFVSIPVPIPVLSLQLPVARFEISPAWFPVPVSAQVGYHHKRCEERVPAPGASTSSAKARESQPRGQNLVHRNPKTYRFQYFYKGFRY